MSLFSKPTDFLGIDFRGDSVKIVQLRNEKGRARLVTYGFTEGIVANVNKKGLEENEGDIVVTIQQIIQKAHITTNQAVAALPAFSVFSSVISLPELPKNELEEAIKIKAQKIIPLPLEEMVLEWRVLPKKEKSALMPAQATSADVIARESKNTEIFITAGTKKLVVKYVDIFKQTGLNLVSLETETFALTRSLIGQDKSIVMLINMGANVTTITIVSDGIPYFSKSLKLGGWDITRAMSDKMGVSDEEAEQFKRDQALMSTQSGQNIIPPTIEEALKPIINEIKFSLNQYQAQTAKRIDKIILTGGSSLLPNITSYFSTVFGVNSYIGDPWARIIYPAELRPVLDEIGPRFAVAVGLAMRNIE